MGFRLRPSRTVQETSTELDGGPTPREQVIYLLQYNGLDAAFVSNNITFVPGRFSDTLPQYAGDPIGLLHLDVASYESYKTTLNLLWPHVVNGGVVAFEEYRSPDWPGATKAIDDFLAARCQQVVKSPVADLYYVVKQPLNDRQ